MDVFIYSKTSSLVDPRTLSLSKLTKKPITVTANINIMKIREILLENKIKRVIAVHQKNLFA